jgi:hypothetical protein
MKLKFHKDISDSTNVTIEKCPYLNILEGIITKNAQAFLKCSFKDNEEGFEDTKGAIRISISKKNRQHNGQEEKDKRTNNDLQNIHIKLKIE